MLTEGLFQLVYCLEVGIQIKSIRDLVHDEGRECDTTLVRLEVSIKAYGIHMREHVSEDMKWD